MESTDMLMDRMFGRAGTQYDFAGADVPTLREKARELESQQKSMKKKINPKAVNMIDR
jgi:structural maintenance of chromosome 2